VVAEGIETEQEMQAMQKVGCTHLQGYLFAKALPADKIEAMVALGRLAAIRNNEPVLGDGAESKVAKRVITGRRGSGGRAA
jgi:predicted signal transduction protein with EAL and GGDEF domain